MANLNAYERELYPHCSKDLMEAGGSGCAITSDKQDSYGEFFNLNGGGVFAMLWDDDGIKMCMPIFYTPYLPKAA